MTAKIKLKKHIVKEKDIDSDCLMFILKFARSIYYSSVPASFHLCLSFFFQLCFTVVLPLVFVLVLRVSCT